MEDYSEKSIFICPVCRGALYKKEKTLVCGRGHSFDVSKEGYVNLLVGKGGGTHGDNREMIAARKRFLARGHYLPLKLLLCARLKQDAPDILLDAGCGEGWYTEGAANALPESRICAVDVSKDAASLCARRLKDRASCAAASVYDLPLAHESVGAVLSVFSPMADKEFSRILVSGGTMYIVAPGARHLWQLKELLYDEPYENELRSKRIPGFEFVKEDELHYTRSLAGEELRDLFMMTPYYYRTPEEGRKRAEDCEQLDVEVAFHLFIYKKKA